MAFALMMPISPAMIIKLIQAKAKPKGVERYVRYLARYMASGDRDALSPDAVGMDYGLTLSRYMGGNIAKADPAPQRVLFRGAQVGGNACDWDEGLADIERRLAKRSKKVKKPVRHAVVSCRNGERLSEDGCADAVVTLARELGCEDAAILWAAHGDTDNFHLHVMVVTIDPETGGALPFEQGQKGQAAWKEAMQRAIARIEHAQDLQHEAGARYRVDGDELVRIDVAKPAARKRTPIRQEVLEWEERSGFASFTRYTQDVAGPILDDATSWVGLHGGLALYGLGVRRSVNGGELFAEGEHVKLSHVDRRHSWNKLVQRLGTYEEPAGIAPSSYEPRILDPGKAAAWLRRDGRERDIAGRIDQRVGALLAARDATLADSGAQLSMHHADVAGFDGAERLRRDLSAAWPRLRTSTLSVIRVAFSARIDAVRALRYAVTDFHDLESVDLNAIGAPDVGIVSSWFCDQGPPQPRTLAGYDAERAGDMVRYWSHDDRDRRGQPAFVDAGGIIWVNDRSDRSIEAALTLAQSRYGDVSVFGDAAYLRQCARVSERLGIPITTITVAQAKRRARPKGNARRDARQRAVDAHVGSTEDPDNRRAWLRAYRRATGIDHRVATYGQVPEMANVLHHSAIPGSLNEGRGEVDANTSNTIRPTPPMPDVGLG